jgi:hypothetical protein
MPSLAGARRLSRLHRHTAAHAAHRLGQSRICPLRYRSAGGRSGGELSSRLAVEHAAAAALRRSPPLSARRGRGPRHHGDLYRGQSRQLVPQLGVHLRQTGFSRAWRPRFGSLHLLRARLHGRSSDRLCLALRAPARPSALSPLGGAAARTAAGARPPRRAGRRANPPRSERVEPVYLRRGMADAGRAGHSHHRAQLRQRDLHGAAGRLGCRRRQRGTCRRRAPDAQVGSHWDWASALC